jgi:hypothetical protein
MLMNHSDARADRVARGMVRKSFSLKPDRSGVRTDHSVEDLHQGAFARTILTQKPNDLSGRHRKIDPLIGANGAVPLADPFHLKHRQRFIWPLTLAQFHIPP